MPQKQKQRYQKEIPQQSSSHTIFQKCLSDWAETNTQTAKKNKTTIPRFRRSNNNATRQPRASTKNESSHLHNFSFAFQMVSLSLDMIWMFVLKFWNCAFDLESLF